MRLGEVVFSHEGYETRFDLGMATKIRSEILYNLFYKLFDVVHADTPALRDEAHRIRYQVFCLENKGYEDPAAHPDGLEKDSFDVRADHVLLIYKPTGKPIGTVRIVKHNEEDWRQSFPLQSLCGSNYLHDEAYVKNSCEFSRLCISTEYRRHIKKEIRNLSGVFNFNRKDPFTMYEKPLLNICLSMAPIALIRGAFEMAINNNVLNIFGIMEQKNITRLENAGLVHEPIGPIMDYHGKRLPFLCNILDVLDNAMVQNYAVWKIVTVKGYNHKQAIEIYNHLNTPKH